MIRLLSLTLVAALALPSDSWSSDAGRADRPNIVFILLDNLGQEWLGCYGSEEKRTPNIDRLAEDGVRFRHCYTPVVCGPSRSSLLTGRYPFRTGFTLHHDAALYSGGGLDPAGEIVLARLLRLVGYKTGIVGKWQINNLYDQPGILKMHGFDEHLVWPGSINRDHVTEDELRRFRKGIADDSVPVTSEITQKIESRYWDPVLLRNEKREVHTGKFGPDVMQAGALDFLDRHQKERFFLYYPMVLTHGKTHTQPVVPTPDNLKEGRPTEEMFGDMVQYARQAGRRSRRPAGQARACATTRSVHRHRQRHRIAAVRASSSGARRAGRPVPAQRSRQRRRPDRQQSAAGPRRPRDRARRLLGCLAHALRLRRRPPCRRSRSSTANRTRSICGILQPRSRPARGSSTSTTRAAWCATSASSSTRPANSTTRRPIATNCTTWPAARPVASRGRQRLEQVLRDLPPDADRRSAAQSIRLQASHRRT